MQGRLLEEMSKFTTIGVATPKYQIQNNFQVNKFNFKNQTQKLPLPHQAWSLMDTKLLVQADWRSWSYTMGTFKLP